MLLSKKMSGLPTRSARRFLIFAAASAALVFSSCTQIQKPAAEPFFAITPPPPKQEFRWSNGKLPKSFDPSRSAAAPETDVVRAIFEGLTDLDGKTLEAIPAAAEKWSASDDKRVWTFQLRKDSRWSNGQHVTADDFVTTWKRLGTLGDKTAHRELIQNIVGLKAEKPESVTPPIDPLEFRHAPAKGAETGAATLIAKLQEQHAPSVISPGPDVLRGDVVGTKQKPAVTAKKFGVEAIGDQTLQVTLELPDKDFPKLVANPIFRPIYGDGTEFESDPLDKGVVTNGAFTIADVGKDGIALDRSETYWNRSAVKLEHVRFVPKDTAEAALDAYKKGEIDAVTNADFEPLVLKLLSPYEDFRQTTHSALNFYEFNARNAPFSDRRVREAMAIAIDRDRLTDVELEGSTQPATVFLPLGSDHTAKLTLDVERARLLLEKAGYANGQGFPSIRLVINRNDTQQRVARTVARMWKQNLNLDTQIVVKETSEIAAVKSSGEFDVIRRGVVLPTADEMVNLTAVLGTAVKNSDLAAKEARPVEFPSGTHNEPAPPLNKKNEKGGPSDAETTSETGLKEPPAIKLLTEDDAIYEINAIPLYFPMSYSLVKPYVKGFEINGFDAVSLNDVTIDSSWQLKSPRRES